MSRVALEEPVMAGEEEQNQEREHLEFGTRNEETREPASFAAPGGNARNGSGAAATAVRSTGSDSVLVPRRSGLLLGSTTAQGSVKSAYLDCRA